jgi:YVTN family beta-propeller protein
MLPGRWSCTKRIWFAPGLAVIVVFVLALSAGASAANSHSVEISAAIHPMVNPAAVSVKTVTVGSKPSTEVYNPANTEVYVVSTPTDSVSAVNSSTYKVTKISVGKEPELLTYAPSTKDVYVENLESNNVSVINTANKVVRSVKLPGVAGVTQIYDPANGNLFAMSYTANTTVISDINHTTWALKTITLPTGAFSLAFDNATNSVVVSDGESNELTVISATNVVTTVKLTVGTWPYFMTYNPFDKDLYITDIGESLKGVSKTGNVSVLSSSNKIIATIKVGNFPLFGTYDPSSHDIYEVNTGYPVGKTYPTSTVSIIGTTNKVVATVTVGKFAGVAIYDPKNAEMYVSCADSNKTYAIDSATNAIAATITTTQYPSGAIYDSALGEIIVGGDTTFLNSSSTAKSVATLIPSSNTGATTLTLGTGPIGDGIWDPSDSGVFASNSGTNTVSVVL